MYAGRLRNAHQVEALTANLISVNRRYQAHAGSESDGIWMLPRLPRPVAPGPSSSSTPAHDVHGGGGAARAEAAYRRFRETHGPTDHSVPPVIEELKAIACDRGLWNLFLPARVRARPSWSTPRLAELTGWSMRAGARRR